MGERRPGASPPPGIEKGRKEGRTSWCGSEALWAKRGKVSVVGGGKAANKCWDGRRRRDTFSSHERQDRVKKPWMGQMRALNRQRLPSWSADAGPREQRPPKALPASSLSWGPKS